MVKADCLGCQGCSRCCHEMGDTILLDPYDIWRFQKGLGKNAQTLLAEGKIALRVVDSVIVPHLKMQPVNIMAPKEKLASKESMLSGKGDRTKEGTLLSDETKGGDVPNRDGQEESEEKCPFLDENGWCTIHAFRPGLCRLFPLGRYYEGDGFRYFLQKSECDHPKAKVKVSKWLDVPELPKYEQYVLTWHQIQKQAESIQQENDDEAFGRNLNMFLLKTFFLTPYDGNEDFYEQFEKRIATYRSIVSI